MKTINVELGERSYPIHIGEKLLTNTMLFRDIISSEQVMVVTNDKVAPLYLEPLIQNLDGLTTDTVVIPDGEEFKTLETMNEIITRLLQNRFSRNSYLIALGGGVIGDITGFAAACYQRGIKYIQVPTTLLAQVDSSVGGKTAVNHKIGKNMIGSFHQPSAVIADIDTLLTLGEREISAGLAEIIKYGLIRDETFFEWLEDNIEKLLDKDPDTLSYAIARSCENKAEVVALDEKETDTRALLNLGHTFGHAIETWLEYKNWLHGEAVGAGMLMAADLSCRLNWITKADLERIKVILKKANLPLTLPEGLDPASIKENMSVDKKVRDGIIYLVLLKSIGNAIVTDQYDEQSLQNTIRSFTTGTEIN